MKKSVFSFLMSVIIIICLGIIFGMCINKKNEGDLLIIPISFPFTGSGSETGDNAKNAYNMCIEKWNNKGGILGKKIKAEYVDNKGEGKMGQTLANQLLLTTKPSIVIEGVSGVCMNSQPVYEKNKIIHLCVAATDNIFNMKPKYTIRSYQPAINTCSYFLNSLKNKFNNNEFVLFYANSEFSLSHKTRFNELVTDMGITIKSENPYLENENIYRNIIAKASLKKDDIVYIAGQYQSLGRLIKQLRESGFKGIIVGDAHVNSNSATDVMGGDKSNLYYVDIKKTEDTYKLMDEYHKKNGKKMDDITILSYNGLDVLLNFISENNNMNTDFISEKINGYSTDGILGISKVINHEIVVELELKKVE
jgi:branched-chain amino acid transport system substrate-binding protein